MNENDISERNGLLIDFITSLELGINITDLPHKPKLLNSDYTLCFAAYVDNFHLKLLKGANQDLLLDIRLKPIKNMDVEGLKLTIKEWMDIYIHQPVHVLKLKDTELFLTGYNHKNKILKKNPYPVFAKYDPLVFYSEEFASNTKERFEEYPLIIT